ncbi:mCG18343, isoform CRA_b, partial [Mus musculus]
RPISSLARPPSLRPAAPWPWRWRRWRPWSRPAAAGTSSCRMKRSLGNLNSHLL